MDSENRKRKADEIVKPEEEETQTAAAVTVEGDIDKEQGGGETTKRVKMSSGSSTNQEETEKESTNVVEEKKGATEEKTVVETPSSPTKSKDEGKTKTPESTAKDENTKEDTPKEEIKSIFGATTGFSGFGAVKPGTGFGFGSNTKTETPAFGSGGGFDSSTSRTSGFGSFSSSANSGFGNSSGLSFGTAQGFGALQTTAAPGSAFGSKSSPSKKSDEDEVETSNTPTTAPIRPIVELPTNYEIRSGEEDEAVLFEARCKTRRLVPAGSEEESDDATAAASGLGAKAAPAVPPSQSLVGNNNKTSGPSATVLVTWQDVGTGPLKVLQHKKTGKFRVVQRREVSPSGPATKVILNVPAYVGGLSKVPPAQEEEIETRQRFQWTTPVEGKAVTYLFKLCSTQEARELVKVLDGTQKSTKDGGAPKNDE